MTRQILPVPNPVPSYWLSDPSHLAELRSTPDLPGESDIAVVGAGMAGVLSAYHMLCALDKEDEAGSSGGEGGVGGVRQSEEGGKRPKVVLLDARRLCEGATGRNGGHVKVQVRTLLDLAGSENNGDTSGSDNGNGGDAGEKRTALQTYVSRVISSLKHIVDTESLDCEFELRRSFDVFTDTADAEDVFCRFEAARKRGEPWTRNVTWYGAETAERVTSVRGAKGAFSVPAASFWPYKFVAGLLGVMVERWGNGVEGRGKGWLNVQMCVPVLSLSSFSSTTTTTSTASSSSSSSSSSSPPNTQPHPHTLHTPHGTLTTTKLLLATNAYTAGLLPKIFTNHILPVRGMASHHTPASSSPLPTIPHLSNTYNLNFGPDKGVDYLNPRPDGSIVVGGGAWLFRSDTESWENNWDDATLFPPRVTGYWKGEDESGAKDDGVGKGKGYMQRNFLGWEDSDSRNDSVWTGIMGKTRDGMPFVGEVPGMEGTWVLAGFNGGGMALIAVAAKAVGGMVVKGVGFGDVWEEEGVLLGMRCCEERLGRV
ncbi:hypothetical protein E8E13_007958 [Curvularia kusanoi]|uniref:FAD dependent oxidoreductase domain-containing protein n=1 Tax=Curvularia kusanoi TaxID=90978 RepID=A0A9P4W5T4_CURKU|nr:hypothetical protein E8E13_007958 [Curvularia kusanoi]